MRKTVSVGPTDELIATALMLSICNGRVAFRAKYTLISQRWYQQNVPKIQKVKIWKLSCLLLKMFYKNFSGFL